MSARVSQRGMLKLIRVDTLRRVHNVCFPREAAAIDICVMYRPDQPALSAQTDPADTFRLSGIYVYSSYS